MPIQTGVYRQNIGGMDLRTAEGSQDPRSAVDCDGIILAGDGAISKLPGRTQVVTGKFSSAPCRFLTFFDDTAGLRTYVAYTDDGATATWWSWENNNSATSLGTVTAGGLVDAAQFQGKLILTGTKFQPQKWTGTGSIANLGGLPITIAAEAVSPTSDGTAFTTGSIFGLCESHENRFWLAGEPDKPAHLFYSVLYDPESWVNSSADLDRGGVMPIRPKDGAGKITAIKSWGEKGLVVFKERKTYFIIGKTSGAVSFTDPFRIADLVIPYGTCSHMSIVQQENDLIFIDQHGYFRSLQNTITNAEAETLNPSYRVQPLLDKIPEKARCYAHASDYIKRNQIRLYYYKDYAEFDIKDSNGDVDTNTRALYHFGDSTEAVAATGTITFSANPTATDTITINGTAFTYVASGATGAQINIGSDLAATLAETKAVLNASADTDVDDATYDHNGSTVLTITHDTAGSAGNSFTLAASAATVSGSTLSGGADSGDALDSSGNSLDLTPTNSPTKFLGFNDYLEDAYHFDGTNQYLRRSAAAGTNASTAYTALSIEAFITVDTLPASGNKDHIYSEDSASGKINLYLWNDSGTHKIVAEIEDNGATSQQAIYTVTLTTATWYYIAMTWDAATITLYVDGVSQATKTWAGTIESSGTDGFSIGAIADGSSGYFDGKIDEVRVSKSARASDDISTFSSGVTRNNNVEAIIDYSKGIVDKKTNQLVRPWTKSTDIVEAGHSLFIDNKFYTGTYDGEIHEQDVGITHGAPHGTSRREGYYTSSWLDGKRPEAVKRVPTIRIWMTAFGTGKFNVETTWEDRRGSITRINLSPDASTGWGDNWNTELIWSSGTGRRLYQFVIHPAGHGKLLQIRFFGWQESVQWSVVYWEIDWEILGSRY